MKPPTLQQLEAYAKLRNLAVDCDAFLMYYEDSEPPWTKKDGKPVSNWKLTMQTWHRVQLERGGMPKCGYSYCKKPGVYIMGKDRDGQPNRYCIDHKPKEKPYMPKELDTANILKMVPQADNRSKSDKVNELRKGLGL